MQRVKLGDVVERIKDKVDKNNSGLEFYIGGEHFDYGEICICDTEQYSDHGGNKRA